MVCSVCIYSPQYILYQVYEMSLQRLSLKFIIERNLFIIKDISVFYVRSETKVRHRSPYGQTSPSLIRYYWFVHIIAQDIVWPLGKDVLNILQCVNKKNLKSVVHH